jgi:hypothetical protein
MSRFFASVLLALFFIGCSSFQPASYTKYGETGYGISFHADGTFTCAASSDVGGVYFQATGIWRRVSRDTVETHITAVSLERMRRPDVFVSPTVKWKFGPGYIAAETCVVERH